MKSDGTTINHFHEKLLLLKDRMNTAKGKAIAQERHEFMESYLQQFMEEWGVEAGSASTASSPVTILGNVDQLPLFSQFQGVQWTEVVGRLDDEQPGFARKAH